MAIAMSYAQHDPEKIKEVLTDESELTDRAAAMGFDTDIEKYWE